MPVPIPSFAKGFVRLSLNIRVNVHYQNNNSWQRSVLVDMNHGEDFWKVPFSGGNIE